MNNTDVTQFGSSVWKEQYSFYKQGALYDLANFLTKEFNVKTIGQKKDREVFIYCDGVYTLGQNLLRGEIQKYLEEFATTQVKNEIIEKVKDLTLTDRTEFDVELRFINLNNGILDLETGDLLSHSPEKMFMYKLPLDYQTEAMCPNTQKFLSEVLGDDDIPVIQEWFGYVLYRAYFIKKAIIFVGDRDTGKSTLLRLFDRFIGKENCSGVGLQRLASDKFSAAHLYNKHINIFDDLSPYDISDNGAFKIATGGGVITGEYKFGDQFQFENYSKLTFSCNRIPSVKDSNDDAFFSRWIVIQFNKTVPVPDKFLMDKISTPEELSGLLNFALEGLKRLLLNQEFSYKKDPEEIKTEMQRSGSGVANFVYDCLLESQLEWISKDRMHTAYLNYASDNNLPAETLANFGKKLTKYANYIADGKKQIEDPETGKKKPDTGWRNVRIKSEVYIEREEEIRDIIDF